MTDEVEGLAAAESADEAHRQPPMAGRLPARWPDVACLGILLLVGLALWMPRLRGPIDLRFDGGVYWVLGTSLAEGKGYRMLNEPGEVQAVQYPPGLPLIVAAHQWAVGSGHLLDAGPPLRLTFMAMSLALTLGAYVLARPYLRPPWALAAALLAAFYPFSYYLSDVLYTEVPYALLAICLALLVRRQQAVWPARRWAFDAASAIVVTAAFLLRTAGLALMAAWVAESLIRRRWAQAAARGAVVMIPVLGWHGYVSATAASAEYADPAYSYQRADWYYSNVPYAQNSRLIDPFTPELGVAGAGDLAARVLKNLLVAPASLGEAAVLPVHYWTWAVGLVSKRLEALALLEPLVRVAVVGLGVLVLIGLGLMLYRREWFFALVVTGSTAIVCLTPWPEQFVRYLAPVTPFLATLLVMSLVWCADAVRSWRLQHGTARRISAVHVLVALVLAGMIGAQLSTLSATYVRLRQPLTYVDAQGEPHTYRRFYYEPEWRTLHAAFDWVRAHAESTDVLATSTPHTAWAHTGVTSVILPLEDDPQAVIEMLDSVPVRFVVLDDIGYPNISPRYATPAIESRPDFWRLVHEIPAGKVRVYERVR